MKVFCFVLSIYILFLTAVPCCADEDCSEDITTEQSDHHNEKHKEHKCSNCSPFMNCGSCVGFTFQVFEPLLFKSIIGVLKESTFIFSTDPPYFLSNDNNTIQSGKFLPQQERLG